MRDFISEISYTFKLTSSYYRFVGRGLKAIHSIALGAVTVDQLPYQFFIYSYREQKLLPNGPCGSILYRQTQGCLPTAKRFQK